MHFFSGTLRTHTCNTVVGKRWNVFAHYYTGAMPANTLEVVWGLCCTLSSERHKRGIMRSVFGYVFIFYMFFYVRIYRFFIIYTSMFFYAYWKSLDLKKISFNSIECLRKRVDLGLARFFIFKGYANFYSKF